MKVLILLDPYFNLNAWGREAPSILDAVIDVRVINDDYDELFEAKDLINENNDCEGAIDDRMKVEAADSIDSLNKHQAEVQGYVVLVKSV